MESQPDFTGSVNLGNTVEFSMRQLAEMHLSQPDITLARQRRGVRPKAPLREVLQPTNAYFKVLLAE
jgi:UDP-glucuronate decarboxylase